MPKAAHALPTTSTTFLGYTYEQWKHRRRWGHKQRTQMKRYLADENIVSLRQVNLHAPRLAVILGVQKLSSPRFRLLIEDKVESALEWYYRDAKQRGMLGALRSSKGEKSELDGGDGDGDVVMTDVDDSDHVAGADMMDVGGDIS